MTREDEKICLRELSNGSKQAFEWLFLEWHPRLVDFFNRILGGDEETAYDYAQDVFFDIWMSRKKFSEVNSFSAYIFQMARFKAYNHFDKNAVKTKFTRDAEVTGSESTPSGEGNFDVAKDPDRPFIVKTSYMDVQALGTSFCVQSFVVT